MFKKIILILLCASILTALEGCDNSKSQGTQGEVALPEETESEEISSEALTEEEMTNNEMTEEETQADNSKELEYNDDLIITLVDYLQQLDVDHEMGEATIEAKINEIKSGAQPIHVIFDRAQYYYVCGYYNAMHEAETDRYCCASEYTWVEYESEKDIKENYDGKTLIAAFQINRSKFAVDILEYKPTPNMEHFQMYEPTFEKGLNIGEPAGLDEATFIYLNSESKENIYHSTEVYNHNYITIPCVEYYEKYYITFWVNTLYADDTWELDEERHNENLYREFGEYYELFKDTMLMNRHSELGDQDALHMYGLIKSETFIDVLSKTIAKERLIIELKEVLETDSEPIVFMPELYIMNGSLSGAYLHKLKIHNNDIYINDNLQAVVEIKRNPVIIYRQAIYDEVDILTRIGKLENPEEVLEVLEKIQNSKSCYVIQKEENIGPGGTKAIYEIDGTYYFVDFSNTWEDVVMMIWNISIGGIYEEP